MKILILTQYFPPEIGAPQNRLFELALRMRKNGVEVTVLTAMPNYPKMVIHPGYKNKRYCYEEIEGIPVHRSSIYVSTNRSFVKRLLNYFSFVFSSWFIRKKINGQFDFILCESPPLFLGLSAVMLCRHFKARLIFNVSDLWPESAEKLGLVNNKLLLKVSYQLEAYLYKSASLITGQTQGIVKNISSRFPAKKVYWLPNGVDIDYYNPDQYSRNWRIQHDFKSDDLLFLYAGIIGHAQGLDVILEVAKLLKGKSHCKFILMGDGPERKRLIEKSKQLDLDNVIFKMPVTKMEMPDILASCDATIIPLKKLDIFKGAIPSKIFESLAMKKPILLGVDGEARELFIEEGKCGLYFMPEDSNDLSNAICAIINEPEILKQFGENARKYVGLKFNRDKIAAELLNELNSLKFDVE